MLQPIPYVGFNGNCAEAMRYYETTLGGKITVMITGAQMPASDQMPPDFADKVVNAQLALPGGGLMYGGDSPPHLPYEGIKGISLALHYGTVAEAEDTYNKFAKDGEPYMPFGPTFWAKGFGMVKDKYGVLWAVNGEMLPMQ